MSMKARRLRAKRHAIRRAAERYDVRLEFVDVGALNNVIRAGLGRFLCKGARGARKYLVTTLGGVQLAAVYDDRYNTITTFLPWEAAEVQRYLNKRMGDRAES